jgi:hypothetical protein
MRSSSGPEIFDTYRWICIGEQWHSRVGSPKKPQGYGLFHYGDSKDIFAAQLGHRGIVSVFPSNTLGEAECQS